MVFVIAASMYIPTSWPKIVFTFGFLLPPSTGMGAFFAICYLQFLFYGIMVGLGWYFNRLKSFLAVLIIIHVVSVILEFKVFKY